MEYTTTAHFILSSNASATEKLHSIRKAARSGSSSKRLREPGGPEIIEAELESELKAARLSG